MGKLGMKLNGRLSRMDGILQAKIKSVKAEILITNTLLCTAQSRNNSFIFGTFCANYLKGRSSPKLTIDRDVEDHCVVNHTWQWAEAATVVSQKYNLKHEVFKNLKMATKGQQTLCPCAVCAAGSPLWWSGP